MIHLALYFANMIHFALYFANLVMQAHHPPEFYKHIFYNPPADSVVCAETDTDDSDDPSPEAAMPLETAPEPVVLGTNASSPDAAMQVGQPLEKTPEPVVLGANASSPDAAMQVGQPLVKTLEPVVLGTNAPMEPAAVVVETPPMPPLSLQSVAVVVETTPVPPIVPQPVVLQDPALETAPKPSASAVAAPKDEVAPEAKDEGSLHFNLQ